MDIISLPVETLYDKIFYTILKTADQDQHEGSLHCNPFIIHLIFTLIWILHGHVVAPIFLPFNFTKETSEQ